MTQVGHSGQVVSDTANTPGTAYTITTASTAILYANPNRVTVFVSNDHSSNVVYLTLGTAAAVANQGIPLRPTAGVAIPEYNGQINAISTGTATVVCISEV